jgi:dipeptidyl aminopeptidase/acylaminoacyl peptidase
MSSTQQYAKQSSFVTAEMVASSIRLNDTQWDGDMLMWHESRGSQGVLMIQFGTEAPREFAPDFSVKGRVGYGGGEFALSNGIVYFISNGRLYRQSVHADIARPITPGFGGAAAPSPSPDGKWVIFVHHYEGADVLALVDNEGKEWSRKLYQESDFVMQPVWSPDSRQIAFITWEHPDMPWDKTALRLMTVDDRMHVVEIETIAGDSAVFQPEFSPDGRYLSYVSDKSGFGQIYLYNLKTGGHQQITDVPCEHGAPAWVQGLRTYGWSADSSKIYTLRNDQGISSAWMLTLATGEQTRLKALNHYTYLYQIAVSRADGLAMIASSSAVPPRVISVHPSQGEHIHRDTATEDLPLETYSIAQPITWTGHDRETVYGLYYPPTNGAARPPLIVHAHSGPTSQAQARYEPELQFFATRGYAVLAVNYRGSTGYGREYAQKLYGNWGVYDVEDAASGAEYLAQQGLADRTKFVILGSSSGGYTVLQSLVDKPGFYRAGICKYGISNHFSFETHKFEQHYTEKLIGTLPEAEELYRQRSPIYHVDRMVDPVILFQGEDDHVVPRSQSDTMVESLKARGIPHEYHVYVGEGHGFRQPETIEHYLNATLRFLEPHLV